MYIIKIKQWKHADKIGGNIIVGHYKPNNFFYENADFTWSQYQSNTKKINGMPYHEWIAFQNARELRDRLEKNNG